MSRYFGESTFPIFEKRDVDVIHVEEGLLEWRLPQTVALLTTTELWLAFGRLVQYITIVTSRLLHHTMPSTNSCTYSDRLSGKIRGILHITKHTGRDSRCHTPSGPRINFPQPIMQLCYFADQPSDMCMCRPQPPSHRDALASTS
jgi:hypothetical protein